MFLLPMNLILIFFFFKKKFIQDRSGHKDFMMEKVVIYLPFKK